MLKTIVVAENPLDVGTWETHKVEDIRPFLMNRFPVWPSGARIYHKEVALNCDVTPVDKSTTERLKDLPGPFFVVVYPQGTVGLGILLAVTIIASIAAVYFLKPKNKGVSPSIDSTTTINNSMGERENKPRPKERIPDIFGKIRATPDLIGVPYRVYNAHIEYEYAYMCLGRGTYDVEDIREDLTQLSEVEGSGAKVFGPNTSPNSGAPQLTVGDTSFSEPVYSIYRHSSVSDQVLLPPNIQVPVLKDTTTARLVHSSPYATEASYVFTNLPSGESLRNYFKAGNQVTIATRELYVGYLPPQNIIGNFDLSGTYTIVSVTDNTLTFTVDPVADRRWSDYLHSLLRGNSGDVSGLNFVEFTMETTAGNYINLRFTTAGVTWYGPYIIDAPDATKIVTNFVAERGLFKENGSTRTPLNVAISLEITPIDSAFQPIGAAQTTTITLNGSASRVISRRGITTELTLSPIGRYRVRACRTTATDINWDGTVMDEVVWRDLYAKAPVSATHFGDVTTIQVLTKSTASTQNLTRKLNLLATRKIPRWETNQFSVTLYATSRAEEILPFVCLDPYIGGRVLSEIDVLGIRSTISAIETYFGSSRAIEFNYSFDDADMSFEETVDAIASAVFCIAYRRGNQIKLSFEQATTDSVLLFNHRNKIPRTELRTVRFGNHNDNDGVEFTFVDSEAYDDSAKVTFYLPENMSAVKPKKIESVGVTNRLQAFLHAWRIWNKIQYQNTSVEFEATQEANLLLLNDRILVADDTRTKTWAGEVEAQNVLELTLSQEVDFEPGANDYHIFLQHSDGTTEALTCAAGTYSDRVIIGQAPRLPLCLDPDLYTRTGYLIVRNTEPRREVPFLVVEKEIKSNMTALIRGVNYDSRYYAKDLDYANGTVDRRGYPQGPGHRWWRIRVTKGWVSSLTSNKIQFRAYSGDPDLCAGGSVICSAEPDPLYYPASFAFDNIETSYWSAGTLAGTNDKSGFTYTTPVTIGYIFATPQRVREVTWSLPINDKQHNAAAPKAPMEGNIQYSDNGVDWVTDWSFVIPVASLWAAPGIHRPITKPT